MTEFTLGLATMGNSAAALLRDGCVIAAVEEERLSRVKNDDSFPFLAIEEVLSIGGIEFSDLSEINVYWQPWKLGTRVGGVLAKSLASTLGARYTLNRAAQMFKFSSGSDNRAGTWLDLFRLKRVLERRFGKIHGKINFVDHHKSHQAYAEEMVDWTNYASLSFDGGGEELSTVLEVITEGKRHQISQHKWPNSLGHFYSTFTGFLGFKMLEGEYKMMGMAPYGKPIFKDAILNELLTLQDGGTYKLNTKLCDYHAALNGQFHSRLKKLFGEPRAPDEEPCQRHVDLAASVQSVFEEALQHLLRSSASSFPEVSRLVLSGGCALNVTANGRVLESGMYNAIIIPPAPHDAGCAIGASLVGRSGKKSVKSPYLGRQYHNDEIADVLDKQGVKAEKLNDEDLVNRVAECLANQNIVAWFQGGSEFGPRALGNRSFLADPRDDAIRDKINDKIKKRELFRPFAPSVLEEHAADIFHLDQVSPYMNIVASVKTTKIPAVTHVDNTARVHTVSQLENPKYYSLISKFYDLTGVPVLLNTSFNIQEPIVYSPGDAVSTFLRSGVDVLCIGSFFVDRGKI